MQQVHSPRPSPFMHLSPVRHKLGEHEAGLRPARSMQHHDEFRNVRWLRSPHAKMMIAGSFNGSLRDTAATRLEPVNDRFGLDSKVRM